MVSSEPALLRDGRATRNAGVPDVHRVCAHATRAARRRAPSYAQSALHAAS